MDPTSAEPLDGIAFSLTDVRNFDGVFPPNSGLRLPINFEADVRIGLAMSSDKKYVVTCCETAQDIVTQQLAIDHDAIGQWLKWLFQRIPPGAFAQVCADARFARHLQNSDGTATISPAEASIAFQFSPIHLPMISAYLETIGLSTAEPTPLQMATFLSKVAASPLTYLFLTLLGRPHSAQDVFRFLEGGHAIDMVMAGIENGTEIFVLARTEDTETSVDAVKLGCVYYGIERHYKDLIPPWRYRLALLAVCRQYAIRLGYGMWLHSEEQRNANF